MESMAAVADSWRTVVNVATELAVSTFVIRNAIATGELTATKVGREWRIHNADLDDYLAQRRNQ